MKWQHFYLLCLCFPVYWNKDEGKSKEMKWNEKEMVKLLKRSSKFHSTFDGHLLFVFYNLRFLCSRGVCVCAGISISICLSIYPKLEMVFINQNEISNEQFQHIINWKSCKTHRLLFLLLLLFCLKNKKAHLKW